MSKGFNYLIAIDSQKCTGCVSCQLACSFHHTGEFGREKSCITINRSNATGEIEVIVSEQCCDMCIGHDQPLCIKFCAPGALYISRKKA